MNNIQMPIITLREKMLTHEIGPCIRWNTEPLQDPIETQRINETTPFPEGVSMIDGELVAICCCCGKYTPIPCDLRDIPGEGYEHYCGGSDRCCP